MDMDNVLFKRLLYIPTRECQRSEGQDYERMDSKSKGKRIIDIICKRRDGKSI